MARNGSGGYTQPVANFVAGTVIDEGDVNTWLGDLGNEIANSIAKDGQTTPTANLPMGGFKHTGVADATARTQYATYGQLLDTTTSDGNLLVNGDFSIFQRGGSSFADDAYCLDRWYALTQTAAIGVSQQTLQADGIATNIRLTQSQATAQRMGVAQIVEAKDTQPYRGSAMVLSAKVRISSGAAVRYALLSWTGTADSVTSDVVGDWTSGTYTTGNFFIGTTTTVEAVGSITPTAATWTAITALTATVSSSANNFVVLFWTEGTAAQNVTLDVANVQLERSAAATTFKVVPYAVNLSRCQRFYTVIPAGLRLQGYNSAGQVLTHIIHFPTTMRTTPNVSTTSSASSNLSGLFYDAQKTDYATLTSNFVATGPAEWILNAVTVEAEL